MKALTLVLASVLALLPLAASAQLPTRCERAQGTSAYPIESIFDWELFFAIQALPE